MRITPSYRLLGKTFLLTFLALLAFAANSVICRMALVDQGIDPASFTLIRLGSGALTLMLLVVLDPKKGNKSSKGSWLSALMLLLYAITFSYAYTTLDAGTGALILFASVQITMIAYSVWKGHKLSALEIMGIILALIGFVYLISPGLNAPSLVGFILMTLSGFGWGMYSLQGKSSNNPLQDTAYNFLRSLPLMILIFLFVLQDINLKHSGVILAILAGAVTSGLGYTIWYMALKGLNTVEASVVQLAVPIIASIGGLILLSENISTRLLISTLLILGGIYLVIRAKIKKVKKSDA